MCWFIILIHRFFPPCTIIWGKQWGEGRRNTWITQFCRAGISAVSEADSRWLLSRWDLTVLPPQEWQDTLHAFQDTLMCVIAFYLHLGVSRRGGLVFTWPKNKQHERNLPEFTLRILMSLLLASGTFCGTTLLAQVRHESVKSACTEVNMPMARPLNLRVEKKVNQWGGGKPSAP